MKALVTGGAGFVGRRLAGLLQARGADVRVLDLQAADVADFIVGSIGDADAAGRACAGVEVVFHLAGVAQLWARDQGVFDRVNHQGARVMLAAASRAGVRRFVHCSSLTTLVGANAPIGPGDAEESLRLAPSEMLGPYPRSKLLAERAVEAAAREGLDAVIAMPTEPIGAGDDALTPPTRMMVDLLNRRTPAVIDATLNFVGVGDLAEGFVAAALKGRAGERYLLGGENIAMRALLSRLEVASGVAMPKAVLPYGVALLAGLVDTGIVARVTGNAPKAPLTGVRLAGRRIAFSSAKAERELGWRAGGFDAPLAEFLAWARATGLWRT
jgi:dihydroflavonol-4-reductase